VKIALSTFSAQQLADTYLDLVRQRKFDAPVFLTVEQAFIERNKIPIAKRDIFRESEFEDLIKIVAKIAGSDVKIVPRFAAVRDEPKEITLIMEQRSGGVINGHTTGFLVNPAEKLIYITDSVGASGHYQDVYKEWLKEGSLQEWTKGYKVVAHRPSRQSDPMNCGLFCIHDLQVVNMRDHGRLIAEVELPTIEQLIATQSVTRLKFVKEFDDLISFVATGDRDPKVIDEAVDKLLFRPDIPAELQRFMLGYLEALPKLMKSAELRETFLAKTLADGVRYSPIDIVKEFIRETEDGKQVNDYINSLRATVIMSAYDARQVSRPF
jgi:hypothetical protein